MLARNLLMAAALVAGAGAADAAIPAYPDIGSPNPANYSFTAQADGDIIAYFLGHTAGYSNSLGLLVNGVNTGLYGLENHSTALGASFNFGHVNAGDVLVFTIHVNSTGEDWYSHRPLNADGLTHIYSTTYAGGDHGVPAGVYVGFEDLNGGGDLDFDDLMFAFTNVSDPVVTVPEPASWAMLIAGFGLVGVAMRRRGLAAAQ